MEGGQLAGATDRESREETRPSPSPEPCFGLDRQERESCIVPRPEFSDLNRIPPRVCVTFPPCLRATPLQCIARYAAKVCEREERLTVANYLLLATHYTFTIKTVADGLSFTLRAFELTSFNSIHAANLDWGLLLGCSGLKYLR